MRTAATSTTRGVSTLAGQLEHYDRGFRMDTAFVNRVGTDARVAVQEVQLLSRRTAFQLDQADQPVLLGHAGERSRAGRHRAVLPAGIRFNFMRAGFLRLDYGSGHETFARTVSSTIGRREVDGGVQILRWLNIGGSAQKGPGSTTTRTHRFRDNSGGATCASACSRARA